MKNYSFEKVDALRIETLKENIDIKTGNGLYLDLLSTDEYAISFNDEEATVYSTLEKAEKYYNLLLKELRSKKL